MIVPEYWAEGRAQHKTRDKSITILRFGWSDASVADAQAMADARAAEALSRHLAGESVRPRDHKLAYNGAEGLPIREQVLARHGNAVITRNLYGARCLNVPDVLFADVDFAPPSTLALSLATFAVVVVAMILGGSAYGWVGALGAGAVAWGVGRIVAKSVAARSAARARGSGHDAAEVRARQRIAAFVATHPDWNLRLYRTPAGLRLLAQHRLFDPNEPAVKEFFDAVGVDAVYARMCRNQRCFRARLTAKPWRIGLRKPMRPRPGVWPIKAEHLPARERWVADYERRAASFAACRYVDSLGGGKVHIDVDRVRELHDDLTQATRELPIA